MKQATEELLRKYIKEPDQQVRVLSNCWTRFDRCLAYCFKHHAYLTETQLKNRQCLQKDCKHCMKVPNKYWDERRKKREHRKSVRRNRGLV